MLDQQRKMFGKKLNEEASVVMEVPTVFDVSEKPAEVINTEDLSEEDLELLHGADPFMYFSITDKRRAAMLCEARDHTSPLTDTGRLQGSSTVATRKTRITFEMDPVQMMFGDINIDIEDDDIDDDGDEYESSFFKPTSKTSQ